MINYIALDLETTGFSPQSDEIIQIGAWKIEEGVVADRFNCFVRPYRYIPKTVQNVTGILMEDVASAETVESILPEFYDWTRGYPFLGHNLQFDYRFLISHGKRLGLDFSENGSRQGICTMKLAKHLLKLKSVKLENLATHFHISISGTPRWHQADFDAYITKLVYDRFAFMYPVLDEVKMPGSLQDKSTEYGEVTNNETLSFI